VALSSSSSGSSAAIQMASISVASLVSQSGPNNSRDTSTSSPDRDRDRDRMGSRGDTASPPLGMGSSHHTGGSHTGGSHHSENDSLQPPPYGLYPYGHSHGGRGLGTEGSGSTGSGALRYADVHSHLIRICPRVPNHLPRCGSAMQCRQMRSISIELTTAAPPACLRGWWRWEYSAERGERATAKHCCQRQCSGSRGRA
jgi:hypothetical protein